MTLSKKTVLIRHNSIQALPVGYLPAEVVNTPFQASDVFNCLAAQPNDLVFNFELLPEQQGCQDDLNQQKPCDIVFFHVPSPSLSNAQSRPLHSERSGAGLPLLASTLRIRPHRHKYDGESDQPPKVRVIREAHPVSVATPLAEAIVQRSMIQLTSLAPPIRRALLIAASCTVTGSRGHHFEPGAP